MLLRQHAKEHSLGYIHAATPAGKLTPLRRSLGLSAWNAPWTTIEAKTNDIRYKDKFKTFLGTVAMAKKFKKFYGVSMTK